MIKCRCRHHKASSGCNIPLVSLVYQAKIEDSISQLLISQNFVNKSRSNVEVIYSFTIPKGSVIELLKLRLDDGTEINAEVKENNDALEDYQDELSRGNTPVLVKAKKNKLKLLIGNLSENASIGVELSLLFPLLSENSFWKFCTPVDFLPKSIGKDMEFFLDIRINTVLPILEYFCSSDVEVELDQSKLVLSGRTNDFNVVSNSLFWVKFRTENLSTMIIQKCNQEYYAALSFICEYEENKRDDEGSGEYFFLIDRSGSMSGSRIKMAVQAAILFLKSLPTNSYFNIVSFGSVFDYMFKSSTKLSAESIDRAVHKLKKMQADYGGTNILNPLQSVFKNPLIQNYPRSIFLLTDGEVDDKSNVIQLIKQNKGLCNLHTFGIHISVDRELIIKAAKAGKGSSFFCDKPEMISSSVIDALKSSIIPGRGSWNISWPNHSEAFPPTETIGLIRPGQYFFQFVKLLELPSENIEIGYEENSCQKTIKASISATKIIQGEFLSKLWAHKKLKYLGLQADINRAQIIDLSLRYKIPSVFTSLFCSVQNNEPVMGELKTLKSKRKSCFKCITSFRGRGGKMDIPRYKTQNFPVSNPISFGEERCRSRTPKFKKDLDIELCESRSRSRSRSRELEATPSIQGSNLYESIICNFRFEGFWKYEDFEKTFKLIPNITINLDSVDKNDIICTMFIIKYLEKYHKDKENEWSLILKKAIKWLNMKGILIENFKEAIEKALVLSVA